MSAKKIMFLLMTAVLIAGFICGCGSGDKSKDEKKANLPAEFTVKQSGKVAGAEKLDELLFASSVSKVKANGISQTDSGEKFGYALDDNETEKLIKLIRDGNIEGKKVAKATYTDASKLDNKGYTLEFTDSMDRFYKGVVRLTFFTTINEVYLNMIDAKGNTVIYQIGIGEELADYLNDIAAENYATAGGNAGWFDKAFK